MKQKRTFVGLLLIVAILCLGIAYAVFTEDELTINGTVTADIADGTVDVEFTNASPAETTEGVTYAKVTEDKDVAEFAVYGLTTENQTETLTFTIENKTENGVPVTLKTPTITNNNTEWYEVTCAYATEDLAAAGQTGDDTTLTVTVKLLKTIATETDKTAANTNNTVTIKLNAEAAGNA